MTSPRVVPSLAAAILAASHSASSTRTERCGLSARGWLAIGAHHASVGVPATRLGAQISRRSNARLTVGARPLGQLTRPCEVFRKRLRLGIGDHGYHFRRRIACAAARADGPRIVHVEPPIVERKRRDRIGGVRRAVAPLPRKWYDRGIAQPTRLAAVDAKAMTPRTAPVLRAFGHGSHLQHVAHDGHGLGATFVADQVVVGCH
jgi:hypothetical protein